MKLIACTSNLPLSKNIAHLLKAPLTQAKFHRFLDKEIFVEVLETVRGEDIFILQSTNNPVNDHLMETLITLDALKRASARRITVCLPYCGYARQDRKSSHRTPITAKLVADLLTTAGANHIITVDLHAPQMQGFFNIPVDNLSSATLFFQDIKAHLSQENLLVVSPDVGGVVRARILAQRLACNLAIVDKRRETPGSSLVMNVVGNVKGYHCLIVDDILDSAGTLCNATAALLKAGAASVRAYVTHGIFSPPALISLEEAGLEEVIVTDSIMATEIVKKCKKIRYLSLAPLFAEAIARIQNEQSVSILCE